MRRTSLLLFLTLAATLFATDKPALLPDVTSREAKNEAVAARVFDEIFNQESSRLRTKSTPATS
jgi:hypothetical protein